MSLRWILVGVIAAALILDVSDALWISGLDWGSVSLIGLTAFMLGLWIGEERDS